MWVIGKIKCMTCAHLNEPQKNSCCNNCIHVAKDNYEPVEKKNSKEKERGIKNDRK